jgi:quercetin dioxygenase-like cupin family protein
MSEVIRIGQVVITFLRSRHHTDGMLDMFEFLVPSGARVPAAHYHTNWDETVYGLDGRLTWVVDGVESVLGRGEHMFIRRGQVHQFVNRGGEDARALAVLTPGVIGPEYFRAMAAVINAGGPPDLAKVKAVMLEFGLVPVPG